MSYRFTTDDKNQETIWPERVKILIDEYENACKAAGLPTNIKLHYTFETIDYHEKIFDDRARERPDSLRTTVYRVYRVKNPRNEEFYMFGATKMCQDARGQQVEPFSFDRYGYHRAPIAAMQRNETREVNEPKVSSFKQAWERRWNKKEVKEMLENSYLPCENFYVGKTGANANDPVEDRHFQIFNLQDFLEGSFEELMELGKYGLSGSEPSLYLLETARAEQKERRKDEARRRIREQSSLTS